MVRQRICHKSHKWQSSWKEEGGHLQLRWGWMRRRIIETFFKVQDNASMPPCQMIASHSFADLSTKFVFIHLNLSQRKCFFWHLVLSRFCNDGWWVPQPSRSSRQLFREFWIQSTDLTVTFAKKYELNNLRRKRKRWQSVPMKKLRENTITCQFPTLHITSPPPSRSSPEFCNNQQTSYFK